MRHGCAARSRTRDLACFEERTQAVKQQDCGACARDHERQEFAGAVVVISPAAAENRQYHEKKADYLVPKAMDRFYDGGNDVLDEDLAVPDCLALPHYFIVTKASQVPVPPSCTAGKLPIQISVRLVNRAVLHYNRNGWRQTQRVERRRSAARPPLREYLWKSH